MYVKHDYRISSRLTCSMVFKIGHVLWISNHITLYYIQTYIHAFFSQRQANLVEGNLVFSSSFNLPRSTQHLCETKFWWSIYWNGPKLVWYCDHWNILEVYQGISCLWSPYFDNPRYIQILCWCFFWIIPDTMFMLFGLSFFLDG
jgi:hypothetical protein